MKTLHTLLMATAITGLSTAAMAEGGLISGKTSAGVGVNTSQSADINANNAIDAGTSGNVNAGVNADVNTSGQVDADSRATTYDRADSSDINADTNADANVNADIDADSDADINADAQMTAEMDAGQIQDVQESLNDRGYALSVDGMWGNNTSAAIRQFQAQNGLPVTGTLTASTLSALNVENR